MKNANQMIEQEETLDDLVHSLVTRQRRFHQLPDDLTPEEQAEVRRLALERLTGASLKHTGHHSFDVAQAGQRNCENLYGVAQVPVGVVGPLHLHGQFVEGDVYVPLATTEGALVASTNRGCAAIRAAGGATVRVEDAGMTRAPVFRTKGIEHTQEFLAWLETHREVIRELAEAGSNHLRLLDIRSSHFGTTVLLRFRFSTGDAMGMNMATIAVDRVVHELIEPETGIECVALSGNYCVDKKPSAINFLEGRGKKVFAEVELEGPVLRKYLKTTARALEEVQYRKNLLGSIAAGSMGFNAHYANTLAAMFIATGQDPAHVVEGSLGITCIEARGPESAYVSIYMPDLPMGAVGGGTQLATQAEALAMLGIEPDAERAGEAVQRLAEIVAGVVLAGELSLMAAFTSQDLARAHERLGRGREARERNGNGR